MELQYDAIMGFGGEAMKCNVHFHFLSGLVLFYTNALKKIVRIRIKGERTVIESSQLTVQAYCFLVFRLDFLLFDEFSTYIKKSGNLKKKLYRFDRF